VSIAGGTIQLSYDSLDGERRLCLSDGHVQ